MHVTAPPTVGIFVCCGVSVGPTVSSPILKPFSADPPEVVQ